MTQSDSDRPASAEEGSNAAATPKPIAEVLLLPDFPRSALGELVDIGGYVGVVVDVVRESLKVRSSEGVTKSFNAGGLRKLYGPRVVIEPLGAAAAARAAEEEAKLEPRREVITEPDFTKPVKKISELVRDPQFPKCALGEHVDVNGYVGVVVEIVNRSLRVRSQAETTRNYNADILRKLHAS